MALLQQDFTFIVGMVRDQSGIVLEAGKEYLIEARLMPVVKAVGLNTLAELTQQLRQKPKGPLADKVIDAMTTNETTFFRDFFPFEVLRTQLIPEFIKKRAGKKELNMWCAAASSGQEPFSVAMMLLENFPSVAYDWKINYIATDISRDMLDRCQRGIYSQVEVNRGLPAPLLVKYFTKVGGDWVLSDKVKKMVKFQPLNLLEPFPNFPAMDIVFIRNVLIYFDLEVKRQILGKIRKVLKPDGYLFLGGAETTVNIDNHFARMQFDKAGCYKLIAEAG